MLFLKTRSLESEMRDWLSARMQELGVIGNVSKLTSSEVLTLISIHFPGGVAEFRRNNRD